MKTKFAILRSQSLRALFALSAFAGSAVVLGAAQRWGS
jgi:hypothetical protein